MTGKIIKKLLPQDFLIIRTAKTTTAVTINKSASKTWARTDFSYYSAPTGYLPIGISRIVLGSSMLGLSYITSEEGITSVFACRNASSGNASSVKPYFDIVYAPQEMVEVDTDTTDKVFKRIKFTKAYSSLAASSTLKITASQLGISVPTGYQIFAVAGAGSGSNSVFAVTFDPFNTNHVLQLRNAGTTSVSSTAFIIITFIRNDYAEQILA